MIRVGIVGATGYTGEELLRLLASHPHAEVVLVTSRAETGRAVHELFPNLRGHYDVSFIAPDQADFSACDCVFYATPHGTAMAGVPAVLAAGARVVDLSADFRIKDIALWEQWYQVEHTAKDWVEQAVYGLPEINREAIRSAQLVANPGCYPTAVSLALLPLLENQLIDVHSIIADAKSGVSGAGRKASVGALLTEASDNFKAYGISGHRHLPEIAQLLSQVAEQPIDPVFIPHLVPMIRGMEATVYALLNDAVDLQSLYEQRYSNEPFVDVMPMGSLPETRSVRGANTCRLAAYRLQGQRVVISSVIDNLVKGASGQAIQNMNLMFDLPETTGLTAPAMMP